MVLSSPKKFTSVANITTATATTIDKRVNANSEHGNKNRRPGPVKTNRGDKVGICKPKLRIDQGR